MDGYITSVFGERVNPVTGKAEFHNGLDIACALGTPAAAVNSGRVLTSADSPTWGKHILLETNGGHSVFYAHLSERLVSEGDYVKRGQIIGKTGATGLVTGAHLHLTVYDGGTEKDPENYFDYRAAD